MDLHSRHSSIDLGQLAQWAAGIGADEALQQAIRESNTSQQALAMASAAGVALGDEVCRHARAFACSVVPASVQVEVFAIDRQGGIVGTAGVIP
jgi:cobalt-precorrin-5B (C1)-methyltransferase